MKKLLSTLLALTLLLSLYGCGAANMDAVADSAPGGYYDSGNMSTGAPAPMPEISPMEPGFDYNSKVESDNYIPETPAIDNPTSSLPENVKMIYRGYLELESTDFDGAVAGLQQLVAAVGGYYESSSTNNYSAYRFASFVVRVPSASYHSFCASVGDLAQLNSQRHTTENISEAYYDTESRLVTQRTKLERLQELLAKAEKMEDIITLESAIAETELQIEYLTGSLRKYDALVDYATVDISLQEVYELTELEQPVVGFGAKLAEAFKTGTSNFVDDLERFALRFARNWVSRLIWLVIWVVVIILVVRWIRKGKKPHLFRRRKKEQIPPPPAVDKPDEK